MILSKNNRVLIITDEDVINGYKNSGWIEVQEEAASVVIDSVEEEQKEVVEEKPKPKRTRKK